MQALAQALAPCLAWHPAPGRAQRAGSLPQPGGAAAPAPAAAAATADAPAAPAPQEQRVPLEGDDAQAAVALLETLINRFPAMFG